MSTILLFFFFIFFYFRRKAKAPLPPPEPKNLEIPSLDEAELTNFTMEQKENIIDKDIELSVVLPGDVIKSTTVNGRYVAWKIILGMEKV